MRRSNVAGDLSNVAAIEIRDGGGAVVLRGQFVEQPEHDDDVERKAQLMQQIVDRTVMLDVWGHDQERMAAIVRPEDREIAYVPLARIPSRSLDEIVNVIRSISPSAQRLTSEQIVQQWQDRIEKTYAAPVLRLGADEEMRRLQGR